jgi:hypothetical protein
VNPTLLTFGNQAYLTTSASKSITVTSAGLLNLLMSQISITGTNATDFAFTSTCPLTPTALVVSATCPINVTFKPTYAGARSANLVINSNDPGTPALSIPLTGNGGLIPLTITANSATINWGAGVPTITSTVSALAGTDTLASLGVFTCSTTYTVTSNAGTYPTKCSGATNPNNAYAITYVAGKLTVNPIAAAIISPVPGITFTGTTATFTWTTGGAAQTYRLTVGPAPGGANYYSSSWTTATSKTVTILPTTGVTLYMRLTTVVNGVQQFVDYTYTASGTPAPATLISPAPGSTTTGKTVTFTWTTGNGVNLYALMLGTKLGTNDIYSSGWIAATSNTVTVMPANGSTVYIRLFSLVNGVQQTIDYTIKSN